MTDRSPMDPACPPTEVNTIRSASILLLKFYMQLNHLIFVYAPKHVCTFKLLGIATISSTCNKANGNNNNDGSKNLLQRWILFKKKTNKNCNEVEQWIDIIKTQRSWNRYRENYLKKYEQETSRRRRKHKKCAHKKPAPAAAAAAEMTNDGGSGVHTN